MNLADQFIGVILFFLVINTGSFFVIFLDKLKSQKNNPERISEGMLFFMATAFGSFGVFAGMLTFRHKTKKWYFILGISLLMIQNCAFLYLVYSFLI